MHVVLIHDYVIHGNHQAVNPQQNGTKAAAHYVFTVPAHGKVEVRVRLAEGQFPHPFEDFADVMQRRRDEADEFYAGIQTEMQEDQVQAMFRRMFDAFGTIDILVNNAGLQQDGRRRLHHRRQPVCRRRHDALPGIRGGRLTVEYQAIGVAFIAAMNQPCGNVRFSPLCRSET